MVFNNKSAFLSIDKGFTLIELLLAVALLILIFSFGPFVGVKTLRDYQISREANYLVNNLRFAQYLSLFQKNDSFFGIKFTEKGYSLIEKPSLDEEGEALRYHPLPRGFKINAPKEIIFQKSTGKPLWDGVVRIVEVTQEGVILHKREININSAGNIEVLK
ncbi:MAG: prepilin-type N-terminal cleavage/methylation domain-containing protein [Candidatus Pacebacteria bacterium]|nr:prepilin-type N-terminal cleavage/methylation domain-containing protein [Candidatus Paceibacterota bacterium]